MGKAKNGKPSSATSIEPRHAGVCVKIGLHIHFNHDSSSLMLRRLSTLSFLFLILTSVDSQAQNNPTAHAWSSVTSPSAGISQSIGTYTSGCVSGAQALPLNGEGYQVMRVSRQRYFGHPNLVSFIQSLGHQTHTAQLGTLLIGDLGQARGGPKAGLATQSFLGSRRTF